jgi:hypothetical protein
MQRESSGGQNLIQVDAEVYGRRIHFGFTGLSPEFVHSDLWKGFRGWDLHQANRS